MNRLHKTPPSRRKAADDWKVLVADAARGMVAAHSGCRPLVGRTKIRAMIIDQLRIALDEAVASEDLTFSRQGEAMIALPGVFRLMLKHSNFDWRSPTAAESVMLVAQRAIDEELASWARGSEGINEKTGRPWTWQERLDYVIRMAVTVARQVGGVSDPDAVRAELRADFELAMGDTPSSEWAGSEDMPTGRGGETERQEVMQMPGVIRMVLQTVDRDWYQPENRAAAEEVVRTSLDAELA